MAINIQQSLYGEIADFLVSQPDLVAWANYNVSSHLQNYMDELLERNAEGILTNDERLELEKILAVSHVMTLAKTKAKLQIVDSV